MTSRLARPIAILLTVLFPASASAHTGVSDASGFLHGFAHPISGLDHVLAMVMVGVIADHLGRRALWAVPFAFVLFMIFGGWLGMVRAPLPSVETGVALSVVVLGSIVAFRAPQSNDLALNTLPFFSDQRALS
ncbi:HupE/UreJ family protein [Rhizobium sp.]|uniref:HupE/UreJ family protein n=1 Tax=Rhizobium sp. TaxID=391 RepID=UPI003917D2E6